MHLAESRTLKAFTTRINGSNFSFQEILEGSNTSFSVSVIGQTFKMVSHDSQNWKIRQQVPAWIGQLETELSQAIISSRNPD